MADEGYRSLAGGLSSPASEQGAPIAGESPQPTGWTEQGPPGSSNGTEDHQPSLNHLGISGGGGVKWTTSGATMMSSSNQDGLPSAPDNNNSNNGNGHNSNINHRSEAAANGGYSGGYNAPPQYMMSSSPYGAPQPLANGGAYMMVVNTQPPGVPGAHPAPWRQHQTPLPPQPPAAAGAAALRGGPQGSSNGGLNNMVPAASSTGFFDERQGHYYESARVAPAAYQGQSWSQQTARLEEARSNYMLPPAGSRDAQPPTLAGGVYGSGMSDHHHAAAAHHHQQQQRHYHPHSNIAHHLIPTGALPPGSVGMGSMGLLPPPPHSTQPPPWLMQQHPSSLMSSSSDGHHFGMIDGNFAKRAKRKREGPKKVCPGCGRSLATATRNCDCGRLFGARERERLALVKQSGSSSTLNSAGGKQEHSLAVLDADARAALLGRIKHSLTAGGFSVAVRTHCQHAPSSGAPANWEELRDHLVENIINDVVEFECIFSKVTPDDTTTTIITNNSSSTNSMSNTTSSNTMSNNNNAEKNPSSPSSVASSPRPATLQEEAGPEAPLENNDDDVVEDEDGDRDDDDIAAKNTATSTAAATDDDDDDKEEEDEDDDAAAAASSEQPGN